MKLAHTVMEFSFNFFTGDLDRQTTELGHCTTMTGSLIQAVHGIMEPKLKAGTTKLLQTFAQLGKAFSAHEDLRREVRNTKERMEDLSERLQSLQRRGKVDLVKLSEVQQDRDATTARCRRSAEEAVVAYESLRHTFLWQVLEEFSEYAKTYQQYFQSGTEFAESLSGKFADWHAQATAIRSEQKEKAVQLSNEGKVSMSNPLLQLLANTEQQYIEQLKTLTQGFLGNVLKDGSLFSEMSRDDVSAIFGAIPPLLEFHQALLKRLVSSQSIASTLDERNLVAMFGCYNRYLEQYCASQEALYTNRRKSKAFAHLLKTLERSQRTELSTALDAPIERLHEYLTFFENLSSQTQQRMSAEESQSLLRVVETIRELDIAAGQVRSSNRVSQITKVVIGWKDGEGPQPPSRRYVGEMSVSLPQAQAQLFLFSDILLIAKKPTVIIPGLSKKHYQFVLSMRIRDTTPRELGEDNTHGMKNALELVDAHQNITLPIGFETEEVRNSTASRIRTLRDELDQNKVFGVDLETLMQSKREKGRDIPLVLEETIEALIQSSLDLEGLFRISASAREMEDIRARIDSGQSVQYSSYNGHAVGGVLKLWLRSLPEPLMTYALFNDFNGAVKGRSIDDAVRSVSAAIAKLPKVNRMCLHRLVTFLALVDRHSANNKMNAKNISIVFSPQLLRQRTQSSLNIADMGMNNTSFDCVLFMIEHCSAIFGEWVRRTQSQQSRRMALTKAVAEAAAAATPSSGSDLDVADDEPTSSELTLSLRDIIKQGSLSKNREKWGSSWDTRWVILKKGWLYHFRSQRDTKGGVVPLQGASVQEATPALVAASAAASASAQKAMKPFAFVVRTSAADAQPQEIVFAAKSQDEATSWIHAINACIP